VVPLRNVLGTKPAVLLGRVKVELDRPRWREAGVREAPEGFENGDNPGAIVVRTR
jgi:hypothetical protein